MKLKDEVEMGGSKSTQTRFVGIIMSTIHPYACFSRLAIMCLFINCDSLVLSLTYYPLAIIMAGRGGGVTLLPGYFIPVPILKKQA